MEPDRAFAELAKLSLANESLESVMQRIAELTLRVLAGADEVSVTLLHQARQRYETIVYTGRLAIDMDNEQYKKEHGPCMHATKFQTLVLIKDMAGDERWPDWSPIAKRHGVGSSLTVPVPVGADVAGALNIYSRTPHAFDDEMIELGSTFAAYASVALSNVYLHESTKRLTEQLQSALESRVMIEQAKGIIMGRRNVDADTAFKRLVHKSQTENVKLVVIATDIVAGRRKP